MLDFPLVGSDIAEINSNSIGDIGFDIKKRSQNRVESDRSPLPRVRYRGDKLSFNRGHGLVEVSVSSMGHELSADGSSPQHIL